MIRLRVLQFAVWEATEQESLRACLYEAKPASLSHLLQLFRGARREGWKEVGRNQGRYCHRRSCNLEWKLAEFSMSELKVHPSSFCTWLCWTLEGVKEALRFVKARVCRAGCSLVSTLSLPKTNVCHVLKETGESLRVDLCWLKFLLLKCFLVFPNISAHRLDWISL